jgi:protein SCO1/2
MPRTLRYFLTAAILLVAAGAAAHEATTAAWIGTEEQLGSYVPLSIRLIGEDGGPVSLGDLVRTPTILSLVYYHCPDSCTLLLQGIAQVLKPLQGTPGRDYSVLTVSFDPAETPEMAQQQKTISLESIGAPFPPASWRFLTGDAENVDRLTDAIGFHYVKNGDDFDHPLGLVILSPDGKIVRYITGTDFLPMDVNMSLMEASTGTVRPTIAKLLRFCFSYNPQSRQFAFNTLKVSALVILALVMSLVLFLVFGGRKRRAQGGAV